MKKSCTLCGCTYSQLFAFKTGHVCEDCLQHLKSDFQADSQVRAKLIDIGPYLLRLLFLMELFLFSASIRLRVFGFITEYPNRPIARLSNAK